MTLDNLDIEHKAFRRGEKVKGGGGGNSLSSDKLNVTGARIAIKN